MFSFDFILCLVLFLSHYFQLKLVLLLHEPDLVVEVGALEVDVVEGEEENDEDDGKEDSIACLQEYLS